MESERIHAEAIIVSDYSENYSHWNSAESLGDWLKREQVPGITGIDTRELTKVLREHGVMLGRIEFDKESDGKNEESGKVDEELPTAVYEGVNYVDRVSCKEIIHYLPDGTSTRSSAHSSFLIPHSSLKKVVLVDCGVKANIIRCLLRRGWKSSAFPGTMISTGWSSTDCLSPMVPAIPTPVMLPFRTSVRR